MDVFSLVAKLTLDSSEYDDGMEAAGKGADNLSGKLRNGLASAAKISAIAITAVGTAATAAGAGFLHAASKTAEYGDNIDKMSQKMGLSSDAYQEWDAVMQHSGTSMEALKASMKTLANAAETDSDAFKELGITQEQIANMSQEELFSATITALQNVEDETKRTYLAGKTLGRGATELGALLNTSAEDTQAMKDRVHELGGVMSESAVKAAARYQDSLQDLQTSMSGLSRGLISNLLPGIATVMDGLTSIFASENGGVELVTQGVDSIITSITESIPKAIEVGGQILSGLAQGISDNLPKIIDSAVEIVMMLAGGLIDALPQIVEGGLQIILGLAQGIADALPELIPTIVETVILIVETLIDNVDLLIDAAIALITGLAEGLIDALPILIQKTPEILAKLVNAIIKNAPKLLEASVKLIVTLAQGIGKALPKLVQPGVDMVMTVISGIGNAFQSLFAKGGEIVSKVKSGIEKAFSTLVASGRNIVLKILSGITEKMGSITTNFRNLITNISNMFGNFQWGTLGRNIVVGLANGITGAAKYVWNAITNILNSAWDEVKSFFGIASPSKLMAWAGQMIDEGFAKGITGDAKKVADAMDELTELTMEPVNASVTVADSLDGEGGAGEPGASSSLGGVVINVYGAAGQDVTELADLVSQRIEALWERRRLTFA